MTDSEWYEAMEKAEKEQFNDDYVPSPEVQKLTSQRKTNSESLLIAGKFSGSPNLQNMIMQLRKAANHPYLFDWPVIPGTDTYLVDSSITNVSGKMLLLERLLPALFAEDHKVLIFSQFTTMLDIIEDWAAQVHDWQCCRIDGSVSQDIRQQQIKAFNTDKDVKLFLLSTRAGGLGINLTSADTVIIFDSDWNPQQDLQAQDRAHRIGQTRVYRFPNLELTLACYRLSTRLCKYSRSSDSGESRLQAKVGEVGYSKGQIQISGGCSCIW
jgi:ATP-dependent DNA helicase